MRRLGWHLNRFLLESRFSAHKCIISWGLVRHITRPPNFFREMKIIKMIIIMRPVRRACVHAHLSLIGGDAHDWVFARLIVATAVVVVLVMAVMCAFAVVVVVVAHAAQIPWICTALSV
jgi:hypothetical protein